MKKVKRLISMIIITDVILLIAAIIIYISVFNEMVPSHAEYYTVINNEFWQDQIGYLTIGSIVPIIFSFIIMGLDDNPDVKAEMWYSFACAARTATVSVAIPAMDADCLNNSYIVMGIATPAISLIMSIIWLIKIIEIDRPYIPIEGWEWI